MRQPAISAYEPKPRTTNLYQLMTSYLTCLLAILWFLSTPLVLQAQSSPPTPEVISRSEVQMSDHKIIFERITPPSAPQAVPTTQGSLAANPQPSPAAQPFLPLSCTVINREMTEVQWTHAGQEYRIWSSIDFHFLTGQGSVESEGRVYALFMGIGDLHTDETTGKLAQFRALPRPSGSGAWYYIVQQPETGADPAAFEGLDALHRYYSANEASLKQKHAAALAAEAAREAYLKAHPPVKKDTVIRFYPIRSVRHGNAPTKEAAR